MDVNIGDLEQLSRLAMPYVLAAARSFGLRVFDRAEDAAVDASAKEGRRLLRRLSRGKAENVPQLAEAVGDVANNPGQESYETVLMVMLLKALQQQSPEMIAELRSLLESAGPTQSYTMHVDGGSAGAQGPGASSVVNNFNAAAGRESAIEDQS